MTHQNKMCQLWRMPEPFCASRKWLWGQGWDYQGLERPLGFGKKSNLIKKAERQYIQGVAKKKEPRIKNGLPGS